MGWSLAHDCLLRGATRRYVDAPIYLGSRSHGCCFEFASIAAEAAREMGIEATPHIGTWHSPTGPVTHAWLEFDGFVLHSPLPNEVEVCPCSDAFAAHLSRS
jgi:hypothetical protein